MSMMNWVLIGVVAVFGVMWWMRRTSRKNAR